MGTNYVLSTIKIDNINVHESNLKGFLVNLNILYDVLNSIIDYVSWLIHEEYKIQEISLSSFKDEIYERFRWLLLRRLGIFAEDYNSDTGLIIGEISLVESVLTKILEISKDIRDNKVNDNDEEDSSEMIFVDKSRAKNIILNSLHAILQYSSITYRLNAMRFTIKDKSFYFISHETLREIFLEMVIKIFKEGPLASNLSRRIPGVFIRASFSSNENSKTLYIHYDLKNIGITMHNRFYNLPTNFTEDSLLYIGEIAYDILERIGRLPYGDLGNFMLLYVFKTNSGDEYLILPGFHKFSSSLGSESDILAVVLADLLFGLILAMSLNISEAYVTIIFRTYFASKKFDGNFNAFIEENTRILRGIRERKNTRVLSFLPPQNRYYFGHEIMSNAINYMFSDNLVWNNKAFSASWQDFFDGILTYSVEWDTNFFGRSNVCYLRPPAKMGKIANSILRISDTKIMLIPIYIYVGDQEDLTEIENKLSLLETKLNECLRAQNRKYILFERSNGRISIITMEARKLIRLIKDEFERIAVSEQRGAIDEIFWKILNRNGLDISLDEFRHSIPDYEVLTEPIEKLILPLIIIDDRDDQKGDISYLATRILAVLFDIPVFPIRYKTIKEKISEENMVLIYNIARGILSRCHLLPIDVDRITLSPHNQWALTINDLRDWLLIGVGLYKVGNEFQGAIATVAQLQRLENYNLFRHNVFISFDEILPEETSRIIFSVGDAIKQALMLSENYDKILIEVPRFLEHLHTDEQKTYLELILKNAISGLENMLSGKNIYVIVRNDLRLPRIYVEHENNIDNPEDDIIFEALDRGEFHKSFVCLFSTVIKSKTEKKAYRTVIPRRIKIYKITIEDGRIRFNRRYSRNAYNVLLVLKLARLLRLNTPISIVKETLPTLITLKYRNLMRIIQRYGNNPYIEDIKGVIALRVKLENDNTIKLKRAGVWSLI